MSHESDFGGRLCGEGKGPDSVLPSRPKQRGFSEETNLTNHTAFELLICRDHRDTTTKSSVFFMQHGYEIWKCLGQESVQRSVVGSGPWCLVSTSHAWQISTSFQPWRKGWRRSVVCWVVVSNICLFSSLFGEMIQFDQYSPDGLVQPPTRLTLISDSGDGRFFSDSRNSDPFLIRPKRWNFFPKNLQKGPGGRLPKWWCFCSKFVDGCGSTSDLATCCWVFSGGFSRKSGSKL